MKTDEELYTPFINTLTDALWKDVKEENTFPTIRPQLAHYTSIKTLELIMVSQELWFSSPLKMNDSEELIFGITVGGRLFREHEDLKKACGTLERHDLLLRQFDYWYDKFENE